MTDVAREFFTELSRRGHEPLLEKVTGTMRFDLVQGEDTDHFFVTISKGDVTVSDETAVPTCIVRADRALFDDIVSGEANAMASMLRGALSFEGDSQLLVSFQRLFPGPSASRGRESTTGTGRRRS